MCLGLRKTENPLVTLRCAIKRVRLTRFLKEAIFCFLISSCVVFDESANFNLWSMCVLGMRRDVWCQCLVLLVLIYAVQLMDLPRHEGMWFHRPLPGKKGVSRLRKAKILSTPKNCDEIRAASSNNDRWQLGGWPWTAVVIDFKPHSSGRPCTLARRICTVKN